MAPVDNDAFVSLVNKEMASNTRPRAVSGDGRPRAPDWMPISRADGLPATIDRPGERPDEEEANPLLTGWSIARYAWRSTLGNWFIRTHAQAAAKRVDRIRASLASEPSERRTQDALIERLQSLQPQMRREGVGGSVTEHAAALLCVLMEHCFGLKPYTVQLEGAWVLLDGRLAEMATGEGKTLTASLAATLAALSGVPTHIVTVNSYLARRDAEFAKPLYDCLGLSVAVVDTTLDLEERRQAYTADIVYAVNKQLAFDYLRDRIAARGTGSQLQVSAEQLAGGAVSVPAMRGLHFAIVDEADSILIDEARTPLIISQKRPNPHLAELATSALLLARMLDEGPDYSINYTERWIELTPKGKQKISKATIENALLLRGRQRREAAAILGIMALKLLKRDEHYVVSDGKVSIVDEYTGRFMPDRTWGQGLQQMVEHKEGVELSDPTETIGQITFQRFFRRYRALAGMTGTAREVRRELWFVYRLVTVPVRRRFPSKLSRSLTRYLETREKKWNHVATRTDALRRQGRAVLLGARTISASEQASAALTTQGIPHVILNAQNDTSEADIIGRAGGLEDDGFGRVTIATNMAGRGTDILLRANIREAGGLAVILSERHDSRRIDRQLIGRAARQDDPGSAEAILSLNDELITAAGLDHVAGRLAPHLRWSGPIGQVLAALLFRMAQRRIESSHRRARAKSVKMDGRLARLLAFSGPLE